MDFWYFLLRRKDHGATESATETPRIWLEKQTPEPARFPQTGWSKQAERRNEDGELPENASGTTTAPSNETSPSRACLKHPRTTRRAFPYIRTRGPSGGVPSSAAARENTGISIHAPNLAESDGTGPVAVGLLHAAGGGGGLASRLGGELAGGLASRGFARRLLGTSHGSGGL